MAEKCALSGTMQPSGVSAAARHSNLIIARQAHDNIMIYLSSVKHVSLQHQTEVPQTSGQFSVVLLEITSTCFLTLRKHAYSNILKISPPKTENFQIKNSDIFHISIQNIDCRYSLELPRRGGSNELPQSMFLSIDKKIMYTPVNPSFTT